MDVVDECFGGGCSPRTDCAGQANYLEFIPTVKMETRQPMQGYVGCEFLAICNHFRVMADWSRKSWKQSATFGVFFKTTPYGEIFKVLFRKDSPPRRSTYGLQISWNLADVKSVKSCVIYLTKTKFRLALPLSLLRKSRPMSARAGPRQCTQSDWLSRV